MSKPGFGQQPVPSTLCDNESQSIGCVEPNEKKVPVISGDIVFSQELCDFLAEVILGLIAKKESNDAA